MTTRPVPAQIRRAASDLGEYLSSWRKLQGLTSQQVAERAGITRQTLSRLENGNLGVGLDVFLCVVQSLGQLDRLVISLDPYETPLGRARADQVLPQRVRR